MDVGEMSSSITDSKNISQKRSITTEEIEKVIK